jgi:hydroxymethylbilane synthase
MRLRILSRASDLARLQAELVARALRTRWPDATLTLDTRSVAGDRDAVTPLASLPDKGAFTADLSDALVSGDADLVVHSWKDLPLEGRPDTVIAATLERADPRDLLLVRRDVVEARPSTVRVLSSSPRRAWLLERALPSFLPWPVERLEFLPVRGNVPTRVRKLMEGEGDALVVAKAAVDRLLSFGPPFDDTAAVMRRMIASCRWMVMPIRDVPGAPAQGALAVEVAATNGRVIDQLREISDAPTWLAVQRERAYLAAHGGGCHAAIAATVLSRPYGVVISAQAKLESGDETIWALDRDVDRERVESAQIWPRPDERSRHRREILPVRDRGVASAIWITRADALPESWPVDPATLVWTSGTRSWRKLAARGVWVHGCADGLGDEESPGLDILAGRAVVWQRLTHRDAAAVDEAGDHVATYIVETDWPGDLASRTHFFWTSGVEFLRALAKWPALRERTHASGPGRTARVIRETLGSSGRASVYLDYDQWYQDLSQ